MHTIYNIVHPATGIYYIGRTQNFATRKSNHLSHLRRGVHSNSVLQEAYNSDPNFIWHTQDVQNKEAAIELERLEIEANKDDPKLANFHFAKPSQAKMDQFTPERRLAIAERMTGTRHTPVTIAKMRERQKDTRFSARAHARAAELNRKEIIVDDKIYRTASEAALALKVHVSTVLNRARNPRANWASWKISENKDKDNALLL